MRPDHEAPPVWVSGNTVTAKVCTSLASESRCRLDSWEAREQVQQLVGTGAWVGQPFDYLGDRVVVERDRCTFARGGAALSDLAPCTPLSLRMESGTQGCPAGERTQHMAEGSTGPPEAAALSVWLHPQSATVPPTSSSAEPRHHRHLIGPYWMCANQAIPATNSTAAT